MTRETEHRIVMTSWGETFFDYDYVRNFSDFFTQAQTAEQVEGLWQLLNLQEGSQILDAPCGYGRLSRALAERGAIVFGVDQSEILLEKAEKDRGQLPATRLRYIRHDLRKPMEDRGFDAAFNVFSSLGYGTEQDDLAMLQTLGLRSGQGDLCSWRRRIVIWLQPFGPVVLPRQGGCPTEL